MIERGVYVYKDRGCQALRFDGMIYQNITPTDIDGLMELHNKAWIVFEAKHRNANCKYGQKLALERFCADVTNAGKHCLVMIVEHDVDNVTDDVFLNPLPIREVMTSENMNWHQPVRPTVVGEAVFLYISKHFGRELIGKEEIERYKRLCRNLKDADAKPKITNKLSAEDALELIRQRLPSLYAVFQGCGDTTISENYVQFKPKDTLWNTYAEHNYLRITKEIKNLIEREFIIESA